MLCLRGFGVEERFAMNKRMGRALFLKLLLVFFVAVHPLPAQEAHKAIHIAVDLREAPKRIYHAKMEFPVAAGPLTLVYPKWIPGEHGPNGPIVDVTGVKFRAGGKEIPWLRDDVDMFAFHCNVPAGANMLEVSLDFLSPAAAPGFSNSPTATAQIGILNWNLVLLYPLGPKSDDLTYVASLRIPAGWKYGTALPVERETSEGIEFKPASLTTLVDSTVLTGAFLRTFELSKGQRPEHRIHIAADSAAAAEATPEQVQHLRQLVAETGVLFGARHYRRYDFLLSLSNNLSFFGEEHHESSDNRGPERMLLDPPILRATADLLPHEFFHSWNGKYRRPAGLATPDYQQPMKGELLWVYEGLTQYYGTMLAARSGFWTPEKLREDLARVAAYLNNWPGRTWRNLQDTAIAAQILYGAREEGSSWRRSVDFYDESTLIWLEADTIIRRETQGKRSLDDFCKKFHGGESTGPEIAPYPFDDVGAAMQEVVAYDWRTFFTERLNTHGPGAPLGGLENTGWRLVYNETMNEQQAIFETLVHRTDVRFSLGMIVHNPGSDNSDAVGDVIPGSPAAQAGIAPDMKLLAVNGRKWTPEILREAIRHAKGGSEPIELLMENEEYFRSYRIDYHGGERYPHLERVESKPDVLGEIAKMRAPALTVGTD
jgi:predicted metalloprotease with PDZ domain